MKSKFIIILLTTFLSLNIAWNVFAKDKPEDVFYTSLSKNEHEYKEYQNATLNIRKKLNGSSELRELEKELDKYKFGDLSYDYPDIEVYFFASIYEENHYKNHQVRWWFSLFICKEYRTDSNGLRVSVNTRV